MSPSPPSGVDYVRDIKPLLRARCYACHGALQQKGGLRLDTVGAMRRGGRHGPVLDADHPERSPLLERVGGADPSERMPPENEGKPLDTVQQQWLRAWLLAGAPGPVDERPEDDPRLHWAFQPPRRPVPPHPVTPGWGRNPIDAFLARHHAEHGLVPTEEAPRSLLIRRLYLDLTGLPPAPEEPGGAAEDVSPGWYERLVDRLLDDPAHGERWARHWMDLWRYSDAWGLGDQLRNSQRHLWHWRDWIVEALNSDRGYDTMVRAMLAADESDPEDPVELRASGYLARNFFLFNRNQWLDETVEHVAKGFLGLTLNCSKCHDHKYDPFPQADYYRFRAFFEPYHVRLDVLPGEPDLSRDGLPRAFDRQLDIPTYRFLRGQEASPDTSTVLSPDVPSALGLPLPPIRRVPLPDSAAQPARRSWVRADLLAAARKSVDRARETHLAAVSGVPSATDASSSRLAELRLRAAEEALASLQARVRASEAEWEGAPDAAVLRGVAVRSERGVRLAEARVAMAEAESSSSDLQAEGGKDRLAKARAALVQAEAEAGKDPGPEETFRPLEGARWSATRFLDSTKDDPSLPFPSESTGRRTALGAWLTDPRNPLTARVAVNHLWARHLGAALVPNVFDFGRKNSTPILVDLLDWLSCEFMEHGWSLKHLHRLIVTSSTYRLGSSLAGDETATNRERDPDNRLFWRRVPVRLEAQAVRDSLLAHAGTLDRALGGPPVPLAAQGASRRRSLYFLHSNNERNAFLGTFDDAAVKECYRREESIVPQQALALLNGRLVQDAVEPIAGRLSGVPSPVAPGPEGDREFIRRAFHRLLGADPTPAEEVEALRALESSVARMPEAREGEGTPSPRALLVWALLNHNDFVTLR